MTPVSPVPSRATSSPLASTIAEIPVFAARTTGSPSSTARMRAEAARMQISYSFARDTTPWTISQRGCVLLRRAPRGAIV